MLPLVPSTPDTNPNHQQHHHPHTACSDSELPLPWELDESHAATTSYTEEDGEFELGSAEIALAIPFPPRRPKIPHNRSTMFPVRRYVPKTPYMGYDLSRVRALWISEEQDMQNLQGTPARPQRDVSEQLVHKCGSCKHARPSGFFAMGGSSDSEDGMDLDLDDEVPSQFEQHGVSDGYDEAADAGMGKMDMAVDTGADSMV